VPLLNDGARGESRNKTSIKATVASYVSDAIPSYPANVVEATADIPATVPIRSDSENGGVRVGEVAIDRSILSVYQH
jgi:hypothetical protein